MHPKLEMFLKARASARACGDLSQVRAIEADLKRVGFDLQNFRRIETQSGLETTAVRAPETATPQARNRGGRPPLPRCEHGKTPGNCRRCPDHK